MSDSERDNVGRVAHNFVGSQEIGVGSQPPSYDVITEVMAESWDEAARILGGPPRNPLSLWTVLAKRILAAAGEGERDPELLKRIALRDLES